MPIITTCRHCRKRLRLPDRTIGRAVMCPRCERVFEATATGLGSDTEKTGGKSRHNGVTASSVLQPDPIGALSALLGLMAILVVCIPYVGYVGFLFSSAGLVIGIWGLVHAGGTGAQRGGAGPSSFVSTPVQQSKGITHPLVGVAICLLALFLALVPWIVHELRKYH
jgi:hypothetical protein